jgi:hypothetical protein
MLTMNSVLGFFFDIRMGKLKIYANRLNVRLVMEKYNEYAQRQLDVEKKIRILSQQKQEHLLEQQHRQSVVTWEQYKSIKGIDAEISMQAYLQYIIAAQ